MKILVIGSMNVDKVLYVNNFPKKGETLESLESLTFHGGKGANQAVAISRLSIKGKNEVSFYGKVGHDSDGEKEIKNLKINGIDTKCIETSNKQTGEATIIISEIEKDNMIIINQGANNDFGKNDWSDMEKAISKTDIIVLQLEINLDAIDKAISLGKKHKKVIIMNPAPAKNFNLKWLPNIDWLIPNETELELISNLSIKNINNIESAILKLRNSGLSKILVTLGSAGIYVDDTNYNFRLPAKNVNVIDTTAAGDTFIGAFLSSQIKYKTQSELETIINFAISAASLTVQRKGAQISIPHRKEVK